MTTACCEFYGLPDDCRELTGTGDGEAHKQKKYRQGPGKV